MITTIIWNIAQIGLIGLATLAVYQMFKAGYVFYKTLKK